jgi:DNA adenine methylase
MSQGFFRYPGGKSKLRNKITMRLADAEKEGLQYREPFFGGGSIGLQLLSKTDIKNIWINDKDIGIACLWTSVIRYIDDFKERINAFVPSVRHFHQFKEELIAIDKMPKQRKKIVDIGFKKLAIHQISYSGLGTKSGGPLGGEKQESIYKIDCRWSPKNICKKATRLHDKFATISIHDNCCTNLDFEELFISGEDDALIYLDPPYFVKGNVLYQEGFTEEDHHRLAGLLKETKHSWVLSYDDCDEVRALYSGWADFHSVDVKYSITATKENGERKSTKKPELLIYPKKKMIKKKTLRIVDDIRVVYTRGEVNDKINRIVKKFVDKLNSKYYADERQAKVEKIAEDNFYGKKSEVFIADYLHQVQDFPRVLPDIEIRIGASKGWDEDLPYNREDKNYPNVHVKSCRESILGFGKGYSWTFQWKNWQSGGGRDAIFDGPDDDLVAFVVMDSAEGNSCTIKAILPWGEVKNLLREPILERLKKIKKCLYFDDL